MPSLAQNMGVNHRSADVLVNEKFLDCSDVVVRFKKMRGGQMPECVTRGSLRKPCLRHGFSDRFLHPFGSPNNTGANSYTPVSMQRILE